MVRPGIRNEVEVKERHLPSQRTRYRGRESTCSIVALCYEVFLCFTLPPVPLSISVTRNEVVRRISGRRSLELLKMREADNPLSISRKWCSPSWIAC